MRLGETCEPHPVHFLFQARKSRAEILMVAIESSMSGESWRTERAAWRDSPAPRISPLRGQQQPARRGAICTVNICATPRGHNKQMSPIHVVHAPFS